MHAIDRLIMDHAAVVGEERAVLTGDVDQRRRKAVRARTVVTALFETGPVGRFRTSRVSMTTATTVTGIDGSESSPMPVLIRGLHIVIQAVAHIKP